MKKFKITGIKKICGESKKLNGQMGGLFMMIYCDMETGEAWGNIYAGHNSWTDYQNKNIWQCGGTMSPLKMKEIKEMITDRKKDYERWIKENKYWEERGADL